MSNESNRYRCYREDGQEYEFNMERLQPQQVVTKKEVCVETKEPDYITCKVKKPNALWVLLALLLTWIILGIIAAIILVLLGYAEDANGDVDVFKAFWQGYLISFFLTLMIAAVVVILIYIP